MVVILSQQTGGRGKTTPASDQSQPLILFHQVKLFFSFSIRMLQLYLQSIHGSHQILDTVKYLLRQGIPLKQFSINQSVCFLRETPFLLKMVVAVTKNKYLKIVTFLFRFGVRNLFSRIKTHICIQFLIFIFIITLCSKELLLRSPFYQ